MGASQSIASATDKQLAEVGPFMLRSSEKQAIDVLSRIVQELLTKNNLFDLEKMLKSKDHCSELFIVISTTVKKEFQSLKFPDPRNPSHTATLSFLQKDRYPPKPSDSVAARNRACDEITHFLIRLVTLAAACTASISRNENIAGLLSVSGEGSDGSSVANAVLDLPSSLTFTNSPLPDDVLSYFSPNVFTKVDERRPNLYSFGNTSTYVIDKSKGIIYNARAEKTPVFRISMKLVNAKHKIGEFSAPAGVPTVTQLLIQAAPGAVGVGGQGAVPGGQGAGTAGQGAGTAVPGAAPAVPGAGTAVPGAAPAVPGAVPTGQGAAPAVPGAGTAGQGADNARSMASGQTGLTARTFGAPSTLTSRAGPGTLFSGSGRRKTRRYRASARRTRRTRQYGGEGHQYVECTIEEMIYGGFNSCDRADICQKLVMIIDSDGNTFSYEEYDNFQRAPVRAITSMVFNTRVQPLFNSIVSNLVATVKYYQRTELSKDRFKKLAGVSEETYATLVDYKDTMKALPTGSAPAPYRAFLLASRLAGKELTTAFCSDAWAGQYTTSVLAYSLLQALYDDGVAGTTPSPRSIDAVKATAKAFTGAQVAVPAAQSGSDVESLANIQFAPIPDSLRKTYCTTAYPQKTSLEDDKRILIATQRELRGLYDKHISDMVGILKEVMSLQKETDEKGNERIYFVLNEKFSTAPEGGLVVLEQIIEKARTLIATHFLAVEKKYAAALLQLARFRRGVTAVNNPEVAKNLLEKADARLEENIGSK